MGEVLASEVYEHHHYGDSKTNAIAHLCVSSSQSRPSDTSLEHPLNVDSKLAFPDYAEDVAELTTSLETCQNSVPTWKPDGKLSWSKMRTCEEPRQQNLHHHHYHYYYYQCSAACSCPSNGVSPSTASQAEPSYNHNTHTHPRCPVHTNRPAELAYSSEGRAPCCPLSPEEHTHIALDPTEHTHNPPTTAQLTKHTHSHISPPTGLHPHTTPSSKRTHIPSISRLQKSTHNHTDLYATPLVHRKKPKKTKTQNKLYTPFPSSRAPPYILCQHCFKLLSLPLSPPLHVLTLLPVLKIKCAFCTRVSFFSTRRQDRMPSSDALGHLHAAKASKGNVDGDFQFKVHVPTCDADAPTCDASSKDEGFLLGLKQDDIDAHAPTSCAFMDGCEGEQQRGDAYVAIIDAIADRSIPHISEQEITDANVRSDDRITEGRTQVKYSSPQLPPKLNPEFAGFSSVQDWVNSIEQDSFLHCPTPLLGTGFGSDLQLQGPIDWQIDDEHRGGGFSIPVPGSPLHEHFGYKSPSELLNKCLSADGEIKMPSDTTSSASTSATSANTFTPPGFENGNRSMYKCKVVFAKQVSNNSMKGGADVEQSNQASLASFFRRSLKGFAEGKSSSVSSPKSKVIVNGHTLSQLALKRAEERAGKLRPGSYWYDSKAGFWGITGGPCLGVLPPFIEELQYPISRDCSNGDTQIYVNGRELHQKDLTVLALRGLSRKPGMAYAVGFNGVVIEETSGRELKHLGKLAPTVERKGKGFGMYTPKQ